MARINPGNTPEEILPVLSEAVAAAITQHKPSLALESFAILLIRLSNDASETADKNIRLQKGMMWLAALVLAIVLAQVWIGYMQLSLARTQQAPGALPTPGSVAPQQQDERLRKKQDTPQIPEPGIVKQDKRGTPNAPIAHKNAPD